MLPHFFNCTVGLLVANKMLSVNEFILRVALLTPYHPPLSSENFRKSLAAIYNDVAFNRWIHNEIQVRDLAAIYSDVAFNRWMHNEIRANDKTAVTYQLPVQEGHCDSQLLLSSQLIVNFARRTT